MSYKYWYSIVWHIQSGTHCAAGYISKWFPLQNMSLYYTTTMLMFFVIHCNILNVPDIHRNIKASTLWWCRCQRKKVTMTTLCFIVMSFAPRVLYVCMQVYFPMMTSSNGKIFRVTGHLCGKFTGPRWISRTKASDAELWCFLWFTSE